LINFLLTFDFNHFGQLSGRVIGRHDGQGREVGDGSNLSDAHPGSSEDGCRNVEKTQKNDVPVKAAALLALLHQDES